jgi:hypothetical protein
VKVWDAQTGQELFAFKDLPHGLEGVVFSPDGKRLAGGVQSGYQKGQLVADSEAKFWLEPVSLEWSRGFPRAELRRIEDLVSEHAALLVRSWHEFFGN